MAKTTKTRFESFIGLVALIGSERHRHATQRLKNQIPGLGWVECPSRAAAPTQIPSMTLTTSISLEEGSFDIEGTKNDGPTHLVVTGGPFSGVIYGVEELLQRKTNKTATTVVFEIPEGLEAPNLAYRSFWTWDHSTNWN